jgi:putative inorganic carbon (HCO3(-)) transporter
MLFTFPLLIFPNDVNSFIIPRYYLLVFVSILAFLILLTNKANMMTSYTILLVIFLILSVVSCLFSSNMMTSWFGMAKLVGFTAKSANKPILFIANLYYYTGFITYIMCGVLFLLGTLVSKPINLLKVFIVSSSLVSLTVLLQFAGIDIVPWNDIAIPLSGTMGNPNYLASLMVFVLPGSLLLYALNDDYLSLFCSAVIFAGLVISNTRGAWITFGFVLTILFIYISKSDTKQKARKVLIICCVIITVLTVLLPMKDGMFFKRGLSVKEEVTSSIQLKDEGGSNRLYIWKEVIKVIENHWLFGIGPDNLVYEKIVYKDAVNTKAHNNLLEIAATMGIPAMLAYIAFILSVFLQYRKGNAFQFTALLMCLSYLVQGLVNIDMLMVYPLFWIVLGMSVACRKSNEFPVSKQELTSFLLSNNQDR